MTDATQTEPFINKFSIVIHEEVTKESGKGTRRNPPDNKSGDERVSAPVEKKAVQPEMIAAK